MLKKLLLVAFFALFSPMFAFEELTESTFDAKIKEGKVIVDFHATWWHSCQVLGENLHTYNTTTKAEDVRIFKVDIVEEKALAKRFKVVSMPLLIYFHEGKEVLKTYGVKTPQELKELEESSF